MYSIAHISLCTLLCNSSPARHACTKLSVLSGIVTIPSHFSRSLGELVKKLLKTFQSKRLGRTKGGAGSILKQKWFSGFDWNSLLARELEVPIKPTVRSADDSESLRF